MNRNVNIVRNRLSLRKPQEESLNILAELAEKLALTKNPELELELAKVRENYKTCSSFERDFPSVCFALATGVGKTRLMGAFISYLYLQKGIRNYFVLAPNITVYNKLYQDFKDPQNPKYVFRGIGEFVQNPPLIINGDNYAELSNLELFESSVHINIFNISKINTEMRGGKLPHIKRFKEYLGESYFQYLAGLEDLVLLMDESHHYRADRGMQVINELSPIIGLELTATPQVERGNQPIPFKNVVYEYSLAKAIKDGFVKEPAVATRRDFDPDQFKATELDTIKLQDGIRIHEVTKAELEIFSRNNKVNLVKPFVLVVARDTEHAKDLMDIISSKDFFEGYYADKVMQIHSNQTGEEKDENIERLVSLEDSDNKIEIVIHVNMLKEGWDVTNLYTIIPIRTAASKTLREQTIGRGLRLPYGRRTGESKVDKLTIVAHEKFEEIINEANKPDSIIKKENIIEITPDSLPDRPVVVTSTSTIDESIKVEEQRIESIESPAEKQTAKNELDFKQVINEVLPSIGREVKNISELKNDEIKKIVIEKAREKLESASQQNIFASQEIKKIEEKYDSIIEDYTNRTIEIPRIFIQQIGEIRGSFKDFDLDTKSLNYLPTSEEIIVYSLAGGKIELIEATGQKYVYDNEENIIVNALIDYPEIDYDEHKNLLFKLSAQVIKKFRSYLSENDLLNVVLYHKQDIGRYIYSQLMEHFYIEESSFQEPMVYPFDKLIEHNYSKEQRDSIHDFRETIIPTSAIQQKVFGGFTKACHTLYKFDSKTEKDFAIILEDNKKVNKWLRPAQRQFHIYWRHNSKPYNPDFVAETDDTIYLIETKKESDISSSEVQEKARAALQYCKHATEFTTQNGGKPWKYILIPHNIVLLNMSFDTLVKNYEVKEEE